MCVGQPLEHLEHQSARFCGVKATATPSPQILERAARAVLHGEVEDTSIRSMIEQRDDMRMRRGCGGCRSRAGRAVARSLRRQCATTSPSERRALTSPPSCEIDHAHPTLAQRRLDGVGWRPFHREITDDHGVAGGVALALFAHVVADAAAREFRRNILMASLTPPYLFRGVDLSLGWPDTAGRAPADCRPGHRRRVRHRSSNTGRGPGLRPR